MTGADAFLGACERHDPRQLAAALDGGVAATAPLDGRWPVQWLLEMYTRSDRLPACVRVLLDRGARLPDPRLAPVLLDDAGGVRAAAAADPAYVHHRVSLRSAFTPLDGATLLHVAAEYGHAAAASALIAAGADVNAAAGLDGDGLGGHTPIFHTVNSNRHGAAPVLAQLLDAGARVDVRVAGLTWGRGFDWESTFFDLTPIAYAQLGLLPQMHRDPRDIDATVRALLAAAGRVVPEMPNVPNRYVHPGTTRAGV